VEDSGGIAQHVGLPCELLEEHQPQAHHSAASHVTPGPEEVQKGVPWPHQFGGLISLKWDEVLVVNRLPSTGREEEEAEGLQ
jgi:hypothetical protein